MRNDFDEMKALAYILYIVTVHPHSLPAILVSYPILSYFLIFSIPSFSPSPSLSASLLNPLLPISLSPPPVTVLEPSPPCECVPVMPVVYAPLPSFESAVLADPVLLSVRESAKEFMFWRRPSDASCEVLVRGGLVGDRIGRGGLHCRL